MAETIAEAIARAKPEHDEVKRALLHLTTAVRTHRASCQADDQKGCGTERRMLAALDAVFGLERELKASMLEAEEALRHG